MTELIVGGAVFAAGTITGFLAGRRGRAQSSLAPKPICGCGHHFSFHDDGGCHATVKTADRWNVDLDATHYSYPRCTCRRQIAMDAVVIPSLAETIGIRPAPTGPARIDTRKDVR